MNLQSNLADHVVTPGDIPFNKYRAFKNQVRELEEPNRFVDGDLLERFSDLDQTAQEEVVKGLNKGVEEVKALVEQLKRLH
jgi:DNA damage-binding protein 1